GETGILLKSLRLTSIQFKVICTIQNKLRALPSMKLSYKEKMNAKKPATFKFDDELPDYTESLKAAVNKISEELKKEKTDYNQKALEKIDDLEKHYYNKIYEQSSV